MLTRGGAPRRPPKLTKTTGQHAVGIADQLRGAMDADDFRDYMLSFLFLRYLSDNYETAAQEGAGARTTDVGDDTGKVPLARGMRTTWTTSRSSRTDAPQGALRDPARAPVGQHRAMARTQMTKLLNTLQAGFKYIEDGIFESTFQGLFSEIDLGSEKLGKTYRTATPSSAPSSRRSPKGWRCSPPTSTRWAMPTNT